MPESDSSDRSFIVQSLGDRIKDWHESRGVILIEPRDAAFDNLTVYSQSVTFSFEKKWLFLCTMKLAAAGDMDQAKRGIYRKLKNCECELAWKGVVRRKPLFKISAQLIKLRSRVDRIEPDATLIKVLGSDSDLIALIEDTKVDEIHVRLHSTAVPASFLSSQDAFLKEMAEYYSNPLGIVWILTASRLLHQGPSYDKTVIGMFDVVARIASIVKDLSMELLSSR